MVRRSAWLDSKSVPGRSGSVVPGVFVSADAGADGRVLVEIGEEGNYVSVPGDGLFEVGGGVLVQLAEDGSPLGVIEGSLSGDYESLVPVGGTAEEALNIRGFSEETREALETATADLEREMGNLQDELDAKDDAISDAAASLVTNDRLREGTLTTWPFVGGAVPEGALAEGSVGDNEIADFAVTARKMKSTRHVLY